MEQTPMIKENIITLLNGDTLECYPKPIKPEIIKEDELKLDMSGNAFSLKKKPQAETSGDNADAQFFFDNAYLFLNHADVILNDSKMFLAQVPVSNGLAYTGGAGFSEPTLGVYLEWWMNCETDIMHDKNGKNALVCQFSGSALSGNNSCMVVYPNGTSESQSRSSFRDIWRSFLNINQRYCFAKQEYDSYTLEDVYEILKAMDYSPECEYIAKLRIRNNRYYNLVQMLNVCNDKMCDMATRLHEGELAEFKKGLDELEAKKAVELENIGRERASWKALWQQEEISQPEYCQKVEALRLREKKLEEEFDSFYEKGVQALLKTGELTVGMIENYLYTHD